MNLNKDLKYLTRNRKKPMSYFSNKQYLQLLSHLTIVVTLLLVHSTVQAIPTPEFDGYINQGDKELSTGQLDAALSSFQKAAAIQSDTELIQQKLANVYLLKGEYANSIKYFHNTLGFNAKSSKAFIGLSLAYLHTGQYALAKAALEEARPYSEKKQDIDKLIDWIKSRQHNQLQP